MVGDTTLFGDKFFCRFFLVQKNTVVLVHIIKNHLFDTKNRESFNEKLAYSCSKCHLTINNKWFI